jgi:hypothetical protein
MPVVNPADIDLQAAALAQQGDRTRNIAGDPQVKGDIVAGASGDDAEGCLAADQGANHAINGPIAAGHNDQLYAGLYGRMDHIFKVAIGPGGINFGQTGDSPG